MSTSVCRASTLLSTRTCSPRPSPLAPRRAAVAVVATISGRPSSRSARGGGCRRCRKPGPGHARLAGRARVAQDGVPGGVDETADGVVVGPPTAPLPRLRAAWRPRLLDRFGRVSWRGARLDPGRTGAIALVLVAAVAAVVAAVGVWTARPQAEPVRGLPAVVVGGALGANGGGTDGAGGARRRWRRRRHNRRWGSGARPEVPQRVQRVRAEVAPLSGRRARHQGVPRTGRAGRHRGPRAQRAACWSSAYPAGSRIPGWCGCQHHAETGIDRWWPGGGAGSASRAVRATGSRGSLSTRRPPGWAAPSGWGDLSWPGTAVSVSRSAARPSGLSGRDRCRHRGQRPRRPARATRRARRPAAVGLAVW